MEYPLTLGVVLVAGPAGSRAAGHFPDIRPPLITANARGWVALALPVLWAAWRHVVPRMKIRKHWQSQCHPTPSALSLPVVAPDERGAVAHRLDPRAIDLRGGGPRPTTTSRLAPNSPAGCRL